MLIHTTSVGETTNNLVSQDFTTGWTGTNVDTRHGNGTIAGVDGEYVVSDDISLSTDVELNKPTINNGFTITGSSEIWFWNSYSQSVTQTITTTDDNDNVITQNRVIQGVQNGYQTYSDQLIISSNTQSDYEINLRYDFSVPGTTGHYGADLKNPSLTVEYTFKEELDSTIENEIVQLFDDFKPEEDIKIIEDNFTFDEAPIMDQGPEVKMEEMEMVEFFDEPVMMEEMKEEESFDEPMMTMTPMIEDDKKEEEPVMEMVMEFFEDEKKKKKEISEEESNSDPTESANAEESDNQEQKETVRSEKTKTVGLETVLDKIETEIKALDKNLQLTSLVKLAAMSGDNPLDAYNIPFYEPRIIYEDQLNLQDNRTIYTQDLTEYKQNDPIAIKKQQLNTILQERQNLINELEVLRNG
jgi:hypothetical protein